MDAGTTPAGGGDGRRYNAATLRALYPGSFDPPTLGHLDVIRRGVALCSELTIAIGRNPAKRPLFTVEERIELLQAALAAERLAAQVVAFDGLVVECARQRGAQWLLRGVRSAADFDYEQTMAQMNRKLAPELDTLFVMAAPEFACVSARLVRDAGRFGADLRGLVPESIRPRLEQRLREGPP
ncbi:MAG: pantetheine-phosphate adenylyltransferase [Planctomycetes bacterium]|nr:pantetheine-phosphate adenylyltransferase [Planctomycetota bacterium]